MHEQRPDDLRVVLDRPVLPEFLDARNLCPLLLEEIREGVAHPRRHARHHVGHQVVAAGTCPVGARLKSVIDIVEDRPGVVDFGRAEAVAVVPVLHLV